MTDTLNSTKTNVTDAQSVAQKEPTKPLNSNDAVAKSFQKETQKTLEEIQTKNKNMSEQISGLVEAMRTVSTPQPNVAQPNRADEVWNRIRAYQAGIKGINFNLKK